MTTTLYIANHKSGYIFIDGKLRAYTFISADLDFEQGNILYRCKVGGENYEFTSDKRVNIFADEDAFKREDYFDNEPIKWSEAINRSLDLSVSRDINDRESCILYQIANNEIVRVDAPTSGFTFEDDRHIFHSQRGEFYDDAEEASLHLDIIKVDENGVETVIPSPASMVALTPEQTDALDRLVLALSKCSELGMCFAIDNCYDQLYCYNNSNVKCRTWDCDRKKVSEYGYGINELMQKVNGKFDIFSLSMDDCQTFVEFKK